MVRINLQYEGDLRVRAEHAPSGVTLKTDAPVDNQGKAASFSPTDLVATGLGSCMAASMGIVARREGIDLKGMSIEVNKIMSQDPPRRIDTLEVELKIPTRPDSDKIALLEETALHCPAAKSIHPQIKMKVNFHWGT
ncbi:MAG TPA: osmotically inducible protein OsmC [Deltaproteobacteria bacterium]|nr:osmotically inducible protein OsmC [Deltaproteobacteria bacterium]